MLQNYFLDGLKMSTFSTFFLSYSIILSRNQRLLFPAALFPKLFLFSCSSSCNSYNLLLFLQPSSVASPFLTLPLLLYCQFFSAAPPPCNSSSLLFFFFSCVFSIPEEPLHVINLEKLVWLFSNTFFFCLFLLLSWQRFLRHRQQFPN